MKTEQEVMGQIYHVRDRDKKGCPVIATSLDFGGKSDQQLVPPEYRVAFTIEINDIKTIFVYKHGREK
jgi:hypothetical protein